MGMILNVWFYFGCLQLLAVCCGMTILNCTQHSTQPWVQSSTACVAYMLKEDNCSRIALPQIFPHLYKHIGGELYPEKPSSFTVVPVEYLRQNGKLYPGANISITPPKTSSIVHIPGFEVNFINMVRNTRYCIIIDLNGTLTAADRSSQFKVSLTRLLGQYYFDVYSLPKPPATEDEGNYLQAFLETRTAYGVDYNTITSGNWVTMISYQTEPRERAIRMWFTAPPPQFNFTEFDVELYSFDNYTKTESGQVDKVRITQLTYTFNNVADGLYVIKVTPYDKYWNDNSRCLCKELNAGSLVCAGCTRTYTKHLELIGKDINQGLPCSFTSSCLAGKGLLCNNGICDCNTTYYYWNGSNCEQKALHGEICKDSGNCRDDLGLNCIQNNCTCGDAGQYWSGRRCQPRLGLGVNCSSTNECKIQDGLMCIDGQCRCNDSQYWSKSKEECKTKVAYNRECIIDEDGCHDGMTCSNLGKCQCRNNQWSDLEQKCVDDDLHTKIALAVVGTVLGVLLIGILGLIVFKYRKPTEKKRPIEHVGHFEGSFDEPMDDFSERAEIKSYFGRQVPGITTIRDEMEKPILEQKTIFLVYTEDHPHHTETIKAFANFLSVHCKCTVVFAPWCLQKIMEDKFRWIINSVENSDYTIIINSMESFHEYQTWKTKQNPYKPLPESPIGDIFLPTIQIVSTKLGKNFDHSKYIMAYFSYTAEHFVIDDFCPGGKYIITKHIDELLIHIHRLNTQNQLQTLTALGLPSKDSLENTPEGRKLLNSIKNAGKHQKDNPNWFVDKMERCDSGIDDDLQLPKQQMNVLSSPSDMMSDVSYANHGFIQDGSLNVNYAPTLIDPSVVSVEFNPSVYYLPEETPARVDTYCGMNDLSGSGNQQDILSFFPPSSIGDDQEMESLSLEISKLNQRTMIELYNHSNSQNDEGLASEIESLGGKSI